MHRGELNRSAAAGWGFAAPRAAGSAIALAAGLLLGGCSTISDTASALNPMPAVSHAYDWVTGKDSALPPPDTAAATPAGQASGNQAAVDQAAASQNPADEGAADIPPVADDQRPPPPSFEQRQKIAEGLVADRTHAQDQLAVEQREGSVTRALGNGQEEGGAASAPGVPDLPATPNGALPATPARAGAGAQVAAATPRPMPAVTTTTTTSTTTTTVSGSLQDVYRQRLAQFNNPAVASADVAMSTPVSSGGDAYSQQLAAQSAYAGGDDSGSVRLPRGVHSLDAFSRRRTAASFEVATVNVGPDVGDLSAADSRSLRDVAQLYREKGGVVRIVGSGAGAAARQLIKMGVPAARIYAGTGDDIMIASATTIYVAY